MIADFLTGLAIGVLVVASLGVTYLALFASGGKR